MEDQLTQEQIFEAIRAEDRREAEAKGLAKGLAKGEAKGEVKGEAKGLAKAAQALVQSMGWTLDQAMTALNISLSRRAEMEKLIKAL